MVNPLTMLPPKIRLACYFALSVIATVWWAWRISDGDWIETIGGVLISFGFGMAASNTGDMPGQQVNADEDGGADLSTILIAAAVAIVVVAVALLIVDGRGGK